MREELQMELLRAAQNVVHDAGPTFEVHPDYLNTLKAVVQQISAEAIEEIKRLTGRNISPRDMWEEAQMQELMQTPDPMDALAVHRRLRNLEAFEDQVTAEVVHNCRGCGRAEELCCEDPCPGVIAERAEGEGV